MKVGEIPQPGNLLEGDPPIASKTTQNLLFDLRDAALRLYQSGTTAQRPPNPVLGQIYNDTTLGQLVYCSTVATDPHSANAVWTPLASGTGSGLASPLTTKGDIWGWDTGNNRIPVGTDQQILNADSTQPLGVAWITPFGGSGPFQKSLLKYRVHWAQTGAGNASFQLFGINGIQGTSIAVTLSNTNFFTQQTRVTAACGTLHTSLGGVNTVDRIIWRGNAAGLGGFSVSMTWGMTTTITAMRAVNGLFNYGNANALGQINPAEPSTFIDALFMGVDSTDTNWQIMCNDSSGTCTKVDTGFGAYSTNTDWYRVTFNCLPNASTVDYLVEQMNTGSTFSGTLSSNLPTNSIFLSWHCENSNNANGAGGVITNAIGYFYSETLY